MYFKSVQAELEWLMTTKADLRGQGNFQQLVSELDPFQDILIFGKRGNNSDVGSF